VAARIRTPLGTVELLRNQPLIPGENDGRFSRTGNLSQIFTAEALAHFGKRRALFI
jgi:hypothetical protein